MRLALLVDRFQPPTPALLDEISAACRHYEHVLVLVAGAGRPRDWRYPLSWQERAALVKAAVNAPNLSVLPVIDTLYDDGLWVAHVRRALASFCAQHNTPPSPTLLVPQDTAGRSLARLFPDWEHAPIAARADRGDLAAFYAGSIPNMIDAGAFEALRQESALIATERAGWVAAEALLGYPIPLQTVDAVIIQSHQVLLVERQSACGPLLALPGTFIGPHQTALESALAAARSKAGLDMPLGALSGRLSARRVFDHPERDPRGWVRTEAFVFDLPASGRMETAKRAKWVALADLDPTRLFADHADIIQATTRGVIPPQDKFLAQAGNG